MKNEIAEEDLPVELNNEKSESQKVIIEQNNQDIHKWIQAFSDCV